MKPYISELIKVAYEHDELRKDLVPLIREELKLAQEYTLVQQGTEDLLNDFPFMAYLKRTYALDKWVHPETNLENSIYTIIEKARNEDEFALDLNSELWKSYGGEDGVSSEALEEIRDAFDNLDLTDFRQGKAVQSFCSLVGKSMTMGSWTGRNTTIGELVDDTLWSIDASYSPLIKAIRKVHKGIDKNEDGELSREEILDYVKLASSAGLELDLGEAQTAGMTASLMKEALEEVLITAITAKINFGKGVGAKWGKKVAVKVVSHMLGAVMDKTGINDRIDEFTEGAVNFVSDKIDTAGESMGVGKLGSRMKRRAEASSLVPSKINSKYKDQVKQLASSVGNTPSASHLQDVATQAMNLAEQYFSEGAAEIDEAIKNSIAYRTHQKMTPNFVQNTLMKLSNEEESEVDKYVLEKMQNTDNHTGIVLSYLQQQVCSMMAELQMAENVGPIAQEIYEEFLSKFENKEERDAVLQMIGNGEL